MHVSQANTKTAKNMDNFIVLTGGPGGGKTTIIEVLRDLGYVVVEETGRSIIRDRLNRGLPPRPEPAEFARLLFETDLGHYRRLAHSTTLTFFDRSFLDSACLIARVDMDYYGQICETLENCRFNRRVFITPPWKAIYRNDGERDQTFEEAIASYETLYAWYQNMGYEPVVLPFCSIEDRVEYILRSIVL
jgi:predicted ATPase